MYVDDIILARNYKEEIDQVKESLNKTFKIKDLGDLRYFLEFWSSKKLERDNNESKEIYIEIVNRCRSFSLQTDSYSYG